MQTQKSGRMSVDEEMKDEITKGAFSEMFEYHIKNLVEFVDKRGTPQRKHQHDKLNDIVLYIQDESDFYQAWENVFRGEVPDYQNDEDGERYNASQTTWIEQLPETLTFQMQRTEFIGGLLSKKQHKHPILPVIYPDRFMYSNRSQVEALRKKVSVLRAKISFLKSCLSQYTNFNQSNLSIESALSQSLHFFAAQGQAQAPEQAGLSQEDMADIQVHLPLKQALFESSIVQ